MIKVASQLLDNISGYMREHPEMVTGLLAGGGIGALGGALATGSSEDDEDSAGSRVSRRVKNALIGAAAGGAAGGGLGYALGANGPLLAPLPEGDESPEMAAVTSIPGRGIMGALGFGIGHYGDNKNIAKARESLLDSLEHNVTTSNGTVKSVRPGNIEAVEAAINTPNANGALKGQYTTLDKYKQWFEGNNPGATPRSFLDAAERAGVDIDYKAIKDRYSGELSTSEKFKDAMEGFDKKTLATSAGRADFVQRLRNAGLIDPKAAGKTNVMNALRGLKTDRRIGNKLFRNKLGLIGAGAGALSPELLELLGLTTGLSSDFTAPMH